MCGTVHLPYGIRWGGHQRLQPPDYFILGPVVVEEIWIKPEADTRLGVLDGVGILGHGPHIRVASDAPDCSCHRLSGRQADTHPV